MAGRPDPDESSELLVLVSKLESALAEYVEKYGPTERAKQAFRLSSLWHARPDNGLGTDVSP